MSLKFRAEVLTDLEDSGACFGGGIGFAAIPGGESVDMVADHLLGHQQCGGEGVCFDLFQVTGHAAAPGPRGGRLGDRAVARLS